MENRLSPIAVKDKLDLGINRSLTESHSGDLLTLDLDKLLEAKDPKNEIQSCSPQDLYRSLMVKGPEDYLAVLQLLSEDQHIRIFDYDVWHEDRLDSLKALRWLELHDEIEPGEMARRYKQLDEEYQVAILQGYIETIDEEDFDLLKDHQRDQWTALPCHTLYYKIKSEDSVIVERIEKLIQCLLRDDINYAYAVLNMACYSVPNEPEHELARFRKARMEEDGFVEFTEARTIFMPLKPHERVGLTAQLDEVDTALTEIEDSRDFLKVAMGKLEEQGQEDFVSALQNGFVYLANAICSACKVEPSDLLAVKHILGYAKSTVNLGLLDLSRGNLSAASGVLQQQPLKLIFRAGVSAVDSVQRDFFSALAGMDELPSHVSKARQYWEVNKIGELLWELDESLPTSIGLERAEKIKAIFSRFPSRVTVGTEGKLVFSPIETFADLLSVRDDLRLVAGLVILQHRLTPMSAKLVDSQVWDSFTKFLQEDDGIKKVTSLAADIQSPGQIVQQLDSQSLQAAKGDFLELLRKSNLCEGMSEEIIVSVTKEVSAIIDSTVVEKI